MSSKKIFTVLGTIIALTVLPLWLAQNKANSQSLQLDNSDEKKIIGTWRVAVDVDPNPIGDPPIFYAYATFNEGGTLIESSSYSLEGSRPGHGVWKKTGKNEFKAVVEKFIEFNPITQQKGIFVFRIEEVINLTGENSFQGFEQVLLCNDAGEECQSLGTAHTQNSRLKVD
ncbi:MAG: hypothetical protein KME28_27130 [Pelatocladus maniniholoensis HA4357-MV3]|jgi:hypothetical protein|uniref:Uncharacterized protein n=1 Tax=Pelatocladus maniniholoensis HA4357-MV3 TaxID=1117104 RepID=A0A9E3LW65_9NOST|nr:hypothetical protein [Pelatocladus maniniholoensis HA4357-MV3]